MKLNYKLISAFISCLLLFFSCSKERVLNLPNEGTIYMPQAVNNRSDLEVYSSEKPQVVYFGAAYGGLKYPAGDISATFIVDNNLVSSYNEKYNTNYVAFPDAAYTISGLSTVIKAGKTSSEPLTITLNSKLFDRSSKFLLPIRVATISEGILDSALSTAYFKIDTIVRPERDVTNLGTLTVSHENNGGPDAGEGSKKLVDGNTSTKFLLFDAISKLPFNFKLTFQNPIILGAYTFTSGNDAPDRDPKSWMLQGSNDNTTWTTVDVRNNETFSGRNMTRRFEFENSTAYKYYRVVVTAIGGGNLFQQSEWRVIEFYEL